MSASPREFTTTDDETISSMSIAQLEVALALNHDVFKAKEASAVGEAACITYLATVKPIRAKLLSLKRDTLGASKTAALPVADDANDEPATDDASFRISLSGVFIGSDDNGCMGHTCMHVGEAPGSCDVLAPYNVMNGKSLYFRKSFVRKTGITPKMAFSTR
jgi:hypothetical protein